MSENKLKKVPGYGIGLGGFMLQYACIIRGL